MSMGLLSVIGDAKSFSKAHYEVLCPIIELSKVSLPAFGEAEITNWTRLFGLMVPHVTASMVQGSCVINAIACIRVFIKFNVFEGQVVYLKINMSRL